MGFQFVVGEAFNWLSRIGLGKANLSGLRKTWKKSRLPTNSQPTRLRYVVFWFYLGLVLSPYAYVSHFGPSLFVGGTSHLPFFTHAGGSQDTSTLLPVWGPLKDCIGPLCQKCLSLLVGQGRYSPFRGPPSRWGRSNLQNSRFLSLHYKAYARGSSQAHQLVIPLLTQANETGSQVF